MYVYVYVYVSTYIYIYINKNKSKYLPTPGNQGERAREAMQNMRKARGGLKLVSRRFRKWRLAFWATGSGRDPSFTALVFYLCGTALGHELCQTKASKLAASSAGRRAN